MESDRMRKNSVYIEYEAGKKYPKPGADTADTPEAFADCGVLLEEDEVVVDIDTIPKEQIREMIRLFDIDTQTVWTERGAHLYFRKPDGYRYGRNGVCALGFRIEMKDRRNTPGGITVRRGGVTRTTENPGKRQELPWFLSAEKKYREMTGLCEGDGRNNALFSHRAKLDGHADTQKILRYINGQLFAEPLPEEEFASVCRSSAGKSAEEDDRPYTKATEIMNRLKCVVWQETIWWWNGKKYVSDPGDDAGLKRKIYDLCPGKTTGYIDEIVKQILYRGRRIESSSFPIRFRNGLVTDGQFLPVKDYREFTPYYIDSVYRPDAAPVTEIDEYLENITGSDEDYRKLLLEAMSYAMITDPETIRAIGRFFILRGDGANGKGTLLQIMKKIYGPENCTALSIKELADTRYQVTMIGKLANLGDDVQPEAINNDQMKVLKNICTADTVSARLLYRQSFSTTYTLKLYFTTNSDLHTFEKGYAYKRRVLWLPMFNEVKKPDPRFISRMTTPAAMEYWVRLLVEAYMRLYAEGKMTECAVVEEYNRQYHIDNNYMAAFLETLDIERDVLGKTGPELCELYQLYNDDSSKPYRPKLINDVLREQGIEPTVKKIAGKTRRVYLRKETSVPES